MFWTYWAHKDLNKPGLEVEISKFHFLYQKQRRLIIHCVCFQN